MLRDALLKDEKGDHIWCAIRSGIPLCCVKFWVGQFDYYPIQRARVYLDKLPNWVQYVPCPKCIESKNFVDILLCEEDQYEICTIRMCGHCEDIDNHPPGRTDPRT